MAKKESRRGGKREGAGRKPLPPGEARTEVFSLKVTEVEKRLLDCTDASKWARAVLMKAANRKAQAAK